MATTAACKQPRGPNIAVSVECMHWRYGCWLELQSQIKPGVGSTIQPAYLHSKDSLLMKKMLAILAVAFLTAGTATAQTATTPTTPGARQGQRDGGRMNMTPEQHADRQAQRLTKQLGLSADQTAQVRAIALAEAQETKTMRANASASTDRQAAMQQMKATREKYDAQLNAVLTPAQATKYTEMRDQKMGKRKDTMKGGKMKAKMKS